MSGTNGIVRPALTNSGKAPMPPDPEVPERAHRRQVPATDKLRILEEADACSAPGHLGQLR